MHARLGSLGRQAALGLAAAFLAMSVMLPAQQASAQNVELGLRVFKRKAECFLCHGWAGDGDYAMDNPGPALRPAGLDRDAVVETIRCGRPESRMPFHLRTAYTDDPATSCYGITEAEIGDQKPNRTRAFLSDREIEAVADYVMAWIMGRGDPTLEECELYFGVGHNSCAPYRN